MKKLDNYPFTGYDYTELSEAWNIPFENIGDDVKPLEYLLKIIIDNAYGVGDNTFVIKKVSKDIRLYLKKMIELCEYSDYNHVWKGLLKIESDVVLIQMVIGLLRHMWN